MAILSNYRKFDLLEVRVIEVPMYILCNIFIVAKIITNKTQKRYRKTVSRNYRISKAS